MVGAETTIDPQGTAPPGTLVALSIVSSCAVAFEVGLLRTLAFVFRYHFLFLVVSLAICGYGLGALFHSLALRIPSPGAGRAARLAGLFALSLPLTTALILGVGVRGLAGTTLPVLLLPILPFALAGALFTELFSKYGREAGRLYGADLLGAALASLVTLPLLSWLGGLGLPLALGTIAALAALILAAGGAGRRQAWGALAVTAILFLSNLGFGWLEVPRLPPGTATDLTKPLLRTLSAPGSTARIVETRWGSLARIDVVEERDIRDAKFLYTDGDTPTNLLRFRGDLREVDGLRAKLPYLAFETSRPRSVLSIGSGAGMDVLMALLAGARRVDAVEVSRPTVELTREMRNFGGDPYGLPGVSVHVQDGRSFVAASRDRYDLILSALTLTASSGRAAMGFTESYIHTREALRDYWQHLAPGGVFALVMQDDRLIHRGLVTCLEVLRGEGIATPAAMLHVALLHDPGLTNTGPYRRLLLLKKSPFSEAEAAGLVARAEERGFAAEYVPHERTAEAPFTHLLSGEATLEQVIAAARAGPDPLTLEPVSDDRPFFVYLHPGLPPYFVPLLATIGALTLLAMAAPVARRGASRGAPEILTALLCALLGAGFMLVEVPLLQQFTLVLGHPARSLVVVLFGLLLGTALGSRVSQRWPEACLPGRVALAAAAVAPLGLAVFFSATPLARGLVAPPGPAQIAAVAAEVFLLGALLGVPFPSVLRLLRNSGEGSIGWAWGINGLASVFGSVLAMALAILSGFRAAFAAGACAYLGAAAAALALGRLRDPTVAASLLTDRKSEPRP